MALRLITPPAAEPLTLEQAKAHLRVTSSDDDTLITALIKAATRNCEGWMGRLLIDQKWELVLDSFPGASVSGVTGTGSIPVTSSSSSDLAIQIPRPPLIEVTQVAYDDAAGDEQILSAASYFVDTVSEPGWIVPAGTLSWPTTIDAINSVRIQFRAGYLSTDSPPVAAVPEDILAGIKLTIGSLYEHRETQIVGSIATKLPFGVEQLLRHHRVLLGMA